MRRSKWRILEEALAIMLLAFFLITSLMLLNGRKAANPRVIDDVRPTEAMEGRLADFHAPERIQWRLDWAEDVTPAEGAAARDEGVLEGTRAAGASANGNG